MPAPSVSSTRTVTGLRRRRRRRHHDHFVPTRCGQLHGRRLHAIALQVEGIPVQAHLPRAGTFHLCIHNPVSRLPRAAHRIPKEVRFLFFSTTHWLTRWLIDWLIDWRARGRKPQPVIWSASDDDGWPWCSSLIIFLAHTVHNQPFILRHFYP